MLQGTMQGVKGLGEIGSGQKQKSAKVQIVSSLASEELSQKYGDLIGSSTASDDILVHAPFCFHLAAFQCYSPQAALWLRGFERRRELELKGANCHDRKPHRTSSSSKDSRIPMQAFESRNDSKILKLISKKKAKNRKWSMTPWNLYSRTTSIREKVPEYISCKAFSCISQGYAVPPIHLPKNVPEML